MPALQRKTNTKKIKLNYKIIAAAGAVVVLVSIISALFYVKVFSHKGIYPGISVCGVDVGGLSLEEAQQKLQENFGEILYDSNISLEFKGKTKKYELSDKYTYDIDATAQKALDEGNKAGIFAKLFGKGVQTDIPLVAAEIEEPINSELLTFALECEKGNSLFEIAENYEHITVDLTKENAFLMDIGKTKSDIFSKVCKADFSPVTFSVKESITADDADIIYSRIERPAVDATVEIIGKETVIKDHQLGIIVDKEELLSNLKAGKKVFDLSITTVMPKITKEHYASKMFTDVLGEQTSNYNNGLVGRTKNLTIAANAVNGVIIAPGKAFSFNGVVGERSYERGFMDATVFTSGGQEDGVGGGICQVSSTLYCAQLYADLETVSRRNHTYNVSYVPDGQDATVVYGSLDYKFKNNTDYPVKIVASVGGGRLNIKIMGYKTDSGKKITIVNQTISTTAFTEKTEEVDSMPAGETHVKQKGQNGVTVDTYKVYWKNGVEQKREFLHRSVYSPMNRIIQVGKAEAVEQPAATEAPAATPAKTKEPAATPTPTVQPEPSKAPEPEHSTDPSIPTSETGI